MSHISLPQYISLSVGQSWILDWERVALQCCRECIIRLCVLRVRNKVLAISPELTRSGVNNVASLVTARVMTVPDVCLLSAFTQSGVLSHMERPALADQYHSNSPLTLCRSGHSFWQKCISWEHTG